MNKSKTFLFSAVAKSIRPRKRLTVSKWADSHRVLTSKSSAEAGRWRTSRMPHLREPMDALSLHVSCEKVVCMFPIQMGKTEIGLAWQGYVMHHAPAPMLSIQPTLELRDRYVAQRINSLLESTAVLSEMFDVKASRKSSNSRDIKDFSGGILVLGGANSPASLSSMPIKYVIADELDRFPWSLRGEGDPLGLIEGRQTNFVRRKSLYISSPTMKGSSRIEEEYLAGDQRNRYVPCPHCSEFIKLKWRILQWQLLAGEVVAVWYVCEKCGAEIEEHEKHSMLKNAVWRAEKQGASYRSYTLNALYSPLGMGWSWRKLVQEWLKVQGDPVKLKRFVNTRLAESWEAKTKFKASELMTRADVFALREIPRGCLILTVGIDTQDDRLAVQLIGFGADRRIFVLDYFEIMGNPALLIDEFMQKSGKLYHYLTEPLLNSCSHSVRIKSAAWDSGGHYADAVYSAVRSNVVPCLLAVKGLSTRGKPILSARPSRQDVNSRGKVIKKGVELWGIGTDTAKDLIFSMFESDADKPLYEQKIRFSAGLDEEYYRMLAAESFDPEKNKYVKKSGVRNESLDTLVYAVAASRHPRLRVHAMRSQDWKRLADVLESDVSDVVSTPDIVDSAPKLRRAVRARPVRSKKSFVGGF